MYAHLFSYYRFLIFLCLVLLLPLSLMGQARKELESEKKAILNRISQANRILKNKQQSKQTELNRLSEIQNQIIQHEQLMQLIATEIKILNKDIEKNQQFISNVNEDLKQLKQEYANMLQFAYKTQARYKRLTLILSSSSVNELLARLRFFRKYEEIRSEQIQQIAALKVLLEEKEKEMYLQKKEKQSLLDSRHEERAKLDALKGDQTQIISRIKKDEQKAHRELLKEKQVLNELNTLISKNIKKADFSESLSADERTLTRSFAKQKGRLHWPVKNGFISAKFGLQTYPEASTGKKLQIEKLGISIRTQPNEIVSSVFAGRVVDVSIIPGNGYLVIIQHGDYFTVYSHLKEVSIKANEKVSTGQAIGKADKIKKNIYEIEFQVWRHQEKLNPEDWIRK
ncbi:MAG: peptidoglycan DD-metalloendopeptidase family protein [Bernardetiaceae bacterium]|nr:peptidoglycan DD-metalloendopeptidase family protein [Bernardetiaceae bacterium]